MDRKAPLADEQREDQRVSGCPGSSRAHSAKVAADARERKNQHRFEAETADQRGRGRFDPDVADEHRGHHDARRAADPAEAVLEHQRQQEGHGADGQAVDEAAGGRRAESPGAKDRQVEQRVARPPHPQHRRGKDSSPAAMLMAAQAAGAWAAGKLQAHHQGSPRPRWSGQVPASPGAGCGHPGSAGTSRRATRKAARPSGRLMRKIQCQDRKWSARRRPRGRGPVPAVRATPGRPSRAADPFWRCLEAPRACPRGPSSRRPRPAAPG